MSLHRLCRNCGHEDAADNNLVYVNDLRPQAQTADAGAEMSKDPTLPHAKGIECAGPDPDKPDGKCGHDEAVFFQAPLKGDSAMKLIFMCCKYARTSRHCMLALGTRAHRPPSRTSRHACRARRLTHLLAACHRAFAGAPTAGCNSARLALLARRVCLICIVPTAARSHEMREEGHDPTLHGLRRARILPEPRIPCNLSCTVRRSPCGVSGSPLPRTLSSPESE